MLSSSFSHPHVRGPAVLSSLLLMASLCGCPTHMAALSHPDGSILSVSGDPALDAGVARLATHSGLISVQDISLIHGAEVSRGLTVQVLLTPLQKPDFDETPGAPTGCKAWSYDLAERAPPSVQDHGGLTLSGLSGGPLPCSFVEGRGYVCDDGAATTNAPASPFLARSFVPGAPLVFALAAAGERGFAIPPTSVTPGEPFVIDDASRALLQHLPIDGTPVTLSCVGTGGSCAPAAASIVRITSTDASTVGLAPSAMPAPVHGTVVISCASLGSESITIPAPALALLLESHRRSPITRIRSAFMRDGIALVTSAPPTAPNVAVLAAGRGFIGFSEP